MSDIKAAVPAWVSLCGQMAPIAGILVFAAPIPTMLQIQREKSVGALPMLPYSSMIVNCVVWFTYGLLKLEPKVWHTNSVGLFLGLYYCYVFHQFCPKNANSLPGTVWQHFQGTFLIASFILMVVVTMPKETATELVGKVGVFFCVLMFGSPLSALKNVIVMKSAKALPLPFTLATCVNCVLWSVFGLLDTHDFNIYAPNILGLCCGIAQLALIGIYGEGTTSSIKSSSEGEELKSNIA
uniref:Sugar transporter SWEET1 n=1 Tax=Odontella aurita TaxID=265563 RepID=A0A7S4N7S0_9STRA|mmetsp:Transcript_52043/g.156183  ORF Transcript_52043/g.156183 Transcript_52043/m.156183 type:complete len:239 (+) Transcript_52043:218-934(+)